MRNSLVSQIRKCVRAGSAIGIVGILALGSIGCSGDLPAAPEVSVPTASADVSAPVATSSRALVNYPSLKASKPGSMTFYQAPRFNKRQDYVTAMSNTKLRITISVYNDSSGYAWPSANQVGHVVVDGVDWFVDFPSVYDAEAYVDIPVSAGSHTAMLVEDYWPTHDLVGNSVTNFTISSGQTVNQRADFDDKDCAPSCPF